MNTALITSIIASIPPLAGIVAKIYLGSSDNRLVSKIEKDIALHDIAPDRSKQVLEQLIYFETLAHSQLRLNKSQRSINWFVAFWILVGFVIIGLIGWGVAYAALTYWWPIWFLFPVVSLFGIAWIIIGAGSLFEDPASDDDDRPEDVDQSDGEESGH